MKDERPTHLDLFSGIGGFALAAQWAGFRTIGFCEIDKYCQRILQKHFGAEIVADTEFARIGMGDKRGLGSQGQEMGKCQDGKGASDKPCDGGKTGDQKVLAEIVPNSERGGCWANWKRESVAGMEAKGQDDAMPTAESSPRIFPDIFDLDGRQFSGVSLITGGFPCQPFSVAGKRRGAADDRAIWPEMFRVISEARPAWVLGENVPGIIPMELDNVLSDLESIGYATRSFVIPACAVDARHRRDRLWIVCRDMGHASTQGLQRHEGQRFPMAQRYVPVNGASNYPGEVCWEPEPAVCQLVNGVSGGLVRYGGRVIPKVKNRVNKLKALGNAIVPAVAFELLKPIYDLIMETHSVIIKDESENTNATCMEKRKEGQEKPVADGAETR